MKNIKKINKGIGMAAVATLIITATPKIVSAAEIANIPISANQNVQGEALQQLKDGLYSIDIRILKEDSDQVSMASSFVEKVNYEIKDGKKYLIVTMKQMELMNNIQALVDGQTVTPNINADTGEVKFEIPSLDSSIVMNMNVVPMGGTKVGFRIDLQEDSVSLIKEYENVNGSKKEESGENKENPTEEKDSSDSDSQEIDTGEQIPSEEQGGNEENVVEEINDKNSESEDGLYSIDTRILKEDSDQVSMASSFVEKVNYEIKDGKKYLIVTMKQMELMNNIQALVDGQTVTPNINADTGEVKFEIPSLDSSIVMNMNVVPMGGTKVGFRIDLQEDSVSLIKKYENVNGSEKEDSGENKENPTEEKDDSNLVDEKSNSGEQTDIVEQEDKNNEDVELIKNEPEQLSREEIEQNIPFVEVGTNNANSKSNSEEKTIDKLPQTGMMVNTGVLATIGTMLSGLGISLRRKK